MLILWLHAALAEPDETPKETVQKEEIQSIYPIFFDGADPDAVRWRTQAASQKDISVLQPKTMTDLASQQSPIMRIQSNSSENWTKIEYLECKGTPVTESKIQHLIQTADNDILYYELEKAEQLLERAEKYLPCLQSQLSIEVMQRLFFLKGILAQIQSDNTKAQKAFHLAVRLKPNLEFGDDFSEDAEVIFNAAKRSLAQSNTIPVSYKPYSPNTNIWINGVPIDPEDFFYAGKNIIQVINDQVETYIVSIPDDTTKTQMIIPAAISNNIVSWVSKPEKRPDLELIFEHLLPPQTEIFLHNDGELWNTQLGSNNWSQLTIPSKYGPKEPFHKVAGRYMFWGGAAITLASGVVLCMNIFDGFKYSTLAAEASDPISYQENTNLYDKAKQGYNLSLITGASGLTISGIGYRMTF